MSDFTYKDAHSNLMKILRAIKKMIIKETRLGEREKLMDAYEAAQRELAKIDSMKLAQNEEKYAALTMRFSDAVDDLEQVEAKAQALADDLNLAADVVGAFGKIIGALRA